MCCYSFYSPKKVEMGLRVGGRARGGGGVLVWLLHKGKYIYPIVWGVWGCHYYLAGTHPPVIAEYIYICFRHHRGFFVRFMYIPLPPSSVHSSSFCVPPHPWSQHPARAQKKTPSSPRFLDSRTLAPRRIIPSRSGRRRRGGGARTRVRPE